MTVKNLFSTVLTIASLTTIGGAIAKKPLLINLGINAGLSSGIGHLVVKQNQQALQKQQLALSNQSTQLELANIEATLVKHQKQLKQQTTRQNLTLAKVSKLDRQQKVTAIAISQQVDKLIDISQNNKSNVVTKNLAADQKVKRSVIVRAIRQPVTRVYIDGNNLSFAAKKMDINLDFKALQLSLMPKTGQASFNYYMGVAAQPTLGHQRFVASLKKYGYQVTQLPIAQFQDGTTKTVGDDMTMGIDIFESSQKGDRVILVSGDGDFIPVVNRIQAKGVKVTVAGYKKLTSYELRQIADDFIELDVIKYQIAKFTKLTIA
jgi:uncharacterized LabA/DUF88 family protein